MITITNEDAITLLAKLADASVDMVCIDPPYTDGKGKNVLQNHKIQTVLDIEKLTKEHFRVLKNDSFYCVFGQMPTIIAWYNSAINAGFLWKEDITWVKRKITSPYQKILRQKESVYIFQKGKADFYKTNGRYEDIKMPLYLDGLLNIDTLNRTFAELKYMKNNNGVQKTMNRGKRTANNDTIHCNPVNSLRTNFENTNFTNVWSFLAHNQQKFNNEDNNIKHPTVKPIELIERLIELCTVENAIVLDDFLGSGTTALACQNTKRDFVGCEIDKDYYEICLKRIEKNITLFTK